jgi:hypothetical protein
MMRKKRRSRDGLVPEFRRPALRGADGQGRLVQALVVIDVHTRELSDLRVHDGWDNELRRGYRR